MLSGFQPHRFWPLCGFSLCCSCSLAACCGHLAVKKPLCLRSLPGEQLSPLGWASQPHRAQCEHSAGGAPRPCAEGALRGTAARAEPPERDAAAEQREQRWERSRAGPGLAAAGGSCGAQPQGAAALWDREALPAPGGRGGPAPQGGRGAGRGSAPAVLSGPSRAVTAGSAEPPVSPCEHQRFIYARFPPPECLVPSVVPLPAAPSSAVSLSAHRALPLLASQPGN